MNHADEWLCIVNQERHILINYLGWSITVYVNIIIEQLGQFLQLNHYLTCFKYH